jgi:ABC-2 type transport system permease protein
LLLLIALLLTLPVPITVGIIAQLDWGPVGAAYLATLLLGAAYISIGLFVSARSDNQIVSLIVTTLLCALLYLIGSPLLTDLLNNSSAEWLRLLGTGSRFESIARGVIDFRDLYYYLSLVIVFLALNIHTLEAQRWDRTTAQPRHRSWRALTALVIANALLGNVWLYGLTQLRVDVTQGHIYSISDATRTYLKQLQEPLLIRGYFSAKTHPLLAPLVPQLKDLLKEYAVAGGSKVRVEFVDPVKNPELEQEANSRYGIKPTPFEMADRYQAALVNSYFDVLVKYGDQYEVLTFRDLIELKARSEGNLDVQLRNPEYDITRAIRKVLYNFRSGGNLLAQLDKPLQFTAYISADAQLPPQLATLKTQITKAVTQRAKAAAGKFTAQFVDPDSGDGAIAKRIQKDYGFQPMATSLLDSKRFYFYMTLTSGAQTVQLTLPEDLSEQSFERNLDAGIKRFASGFTKTIAWMAPKSNPYAAQFGMGGGGPQFHQLRELLAQSMNIVDTQLDDGRVPAQADLLLVLAPENIDDKQRFAIDQFLMQGGTVIAATSPFSAQVSNNSLRVAAHHSGLEDWLKFEGIDIAKTLVLDPQNTPFPVPVERSVGGFNFQELRMLDYPYFADVRGAGLDQDSPITSALQQVTMNWASPITVTAGADAKRTATVLLRSSPRSWVSDSTDVMPRIHADGSSGFAASGKQEARPLGVLLAGEFHSFYRDKPSPLLAAAPDAGKDGARKDGKAAAKTPADAAGKNPTVSGIIKKSPQSARLFVFASNEFLNDQTLGLAASMTGTKSLQPLELVLNAAEWSVEDRGLLSIRSRSHFNRTLPPLRHDAQLFWECFNYALAIAGLIIVAVARGVGQRRKLARYSEIVAAGRV